MHHGTTLTWQSREGSYDFADSFPTKGRVLRDCTPRALPRASRSGRRVASLLTMTRQAVQRCTSALLPLNYPVHGAQGAPLQSNL